MILVEQLNQYTELLKDRVPGIGHHLVVFNESHLFKQLSELQQNQFPLLVATFPAALGQGKTTDSITFNNAVIFMVLFKDDQSNRTFAQELAQYNSAQAIILNIVQQMVNDVADPLLACSFATKLDPTSLSIEPENLIAGCEGWSLTVTYAKTQLPQNFEELAALYPQSFTWLAENW